MRIFLLLLVAATYPFLSSLADGVGTTTIDGCTWIYTIKSGSATISSVWPVNETMEIPEKVDGCSVVALKDSFCQGSSELVYVKIPDTVTQIGQSAFAYCPNLRGVELSSFVASIGYGAFSGCPLLQDADGLVVVGDWLCGYLGTSTRLVLPDGVAKIRDYAFTSVSLKELVIGPNLKKIGVGVFSGCSSLEFINVSECNSAFASVDGVLYDKGVSELLHCPAMKKKVFVPASVERIEGYFGNCENLEEISVDVGNGDYMSIDGVLYNKDGSQLLRCPRKMAQVSISNGTKELLSQSFADCSEIRSVFVPEDVEKLGSAVFIRCSKLETITLPSTLISLSELVFDGCSRLQRIDVADGNPNYMSIDGVLYAKSGLTLVALPSGLKTYIVPSGVREIGYPGFYHCENLTTLAFPKSLNEVHSGSFNLCENLTTIYTDPGDSDRIWDIIKEQFKIRAWDSERGYYEYYDDRVKIIEAVEVKIPGGPTISSNWTINFSAFETCYGSDFAAAVMKKTGKFDVNGNAMYVWQDFVTGTDPTDPESKFTTSIEFIDGKPVVTWSPDLNENGAKSVRTYTTYGCSELGGEWVDVDCVPEDEKSFLRFYKVGVDMK